MRENHFPIINAVVVVAAVIQSDITICVRSCEFEWMDENEHAMKKQKKKQWESSGRATERKTGKKQQNKKTKS